ncbi:MAG: hypothetical protein ACK4M7_01495, partial [Burkholderiales bacterium]
YVFELDVATILAAKPELTVHPVSKFPKVERDLAFVVPQVTNVGWLIAAFKVAAISHLIDLTVFDIYQGPNVASGYKSIAINFVFQAEKTLTEDEINLSMAAITQLLRDKFNAKLR